MRPTAELLRGEFIGESVVIAGAKNASLKGLHGVIIDETKHTFRMETEKGRKTLLKNQVTIEMMHEARKVRIEGRLLVGRPEDRVKLKVM